MTNQDDVGGETIYSEVLSAVFSFDKSKIITTSINTKVKLWNTEDGRMLQELMHAGVITSAVFAPLDNRMLTASEDGTAILWDEAGTNTAVFKHKKPVLSAVFSNNGLFVLTASRDATAALWKKDGTKISEFQHGSAVLSADFSPDGKRILTATEAGISRLWNRKGILMAEFGKHNGPVVSAKFSPNGKRVVTASRDGTAKIWLTPADIYNWLKTANIPKLSEREEKALQK